MRAPGGRRGDSGGKAGGRGLKARVRTAKGRKISSTRWLKRQINDPYVASAHARGYRSRAAFKLAQIDDRFHILRPGARIVDLGAAPGGWTQVAVERVDPLGGKGGRILAFDLQEMEPVAGAEFLRGDVQDAGAAAALAGALEGPADVVLSDMSPATTGHSRTDHLRIMALCETAFAVAREVLASGGAFVAKVFQGGAQGEFLAALKRDFRTVRHVKPAASRKESAEVYVVALGFRGGA